MFFACLKWQRNIPKKLKEGLGSREPLIQNTSQLTLPSVPEETHAKFEVNRRSGCGGFQSGVQGRHRFLDLLVGQLAVAQPTTAMCYHLKRDVFLSCSPVSMSVFHTSAKTKKAHLRDPLLLLKTNAAEFQWGSFFSTYFHKDLQFSVWNNNYLTRAHKTRLKCARHPTLTQRPTNNIKNFNVIIS